MLVWAANEYGNIIGYHDERRKFFDKAVDDFRAVKTAFPANRIARMYLGEPISREPSVAAPSAAPAWAVLQREGLERLGDIVHWWIDHRLQKDGQYGGGWDDDCEMWRDWVPVMIAFEDPKITRAQALFSQALLSQPYMKGGYTSHRLRRRAHGRALEGHDHADDAPGARRSAVASPGTPDRRSGRNALDRPKPARLRPVQEHLFQCREGGPRSEAGVRHAVQRRGGPAGAALVAAHRRPPSGHWVSAWMDTWVEATARAEHGKPAGVIPAAIRWPDGAVRGPGENWWDPRHHDEPRLYEWPSAVGMLADTLLLTWHMTGKEKYLGPLRSMAAIRLKYLTERPKGELAEGSEVWCGSQLGFLAPTLARYRLLTGSTEFDAVLARDYAALAIDESARDRISPVNSSGSTCGKQSIPRSILRDQHK